MSKQPDFFKPLPSEKPLARRNGVAYSRESQERTNSFEAYRNAIRDLDNKVSHLANYSGDGLISGWIAVHQRHLENLDTARAAFMSRLNTFTSTEAETPIQRDRHGDPINGLTPDKLERQPGETPEQHEMRLFRDFAIRIPEGTDFPVDTAFFLPKPPDKTLELLTHIRDLLEQLVAGQTRTAVSVGEINTFSAPDAHLSEYKRAVRHAAQSNPAPTGPDSARKTAVIASEIVLTGDPDIGVSHAVYDGHNRVAIRLKDRTAHMSTATADALAAQIKRTVKAVDEGWVAPVPSAPSAAEGDKL